MADTTSNGIQKKIYELDPFEAEVTTGESGSSASFSPDDDPSPSAAWVAASVGSSDTGRYTVRLPLPVAGPGLEAAKDGVVGVKYDPDTMEINPDGSLRAKAGTPAGVQFVVGNVSLVEGRNMLEFTKATSTGSGVYVSPDKYAGKTLEPGTVVVPGKYRWIKVDAILAFTVASFANSTWEYRCRFTVEESSGASHDFGFVLDTTEQISVVPVSISIYNGSGSPVTLNTGVTWDKSGESDVGVKYNATVTLTAI